MTRKELVHVRFVLDKIRNRAGAVPPEVALALAHVDKDIAHRDWQSQVQRKDRDSNRDYDWPFYGQ